MSRPLIVIVLAMTACAGPTEPALDQYLLGRWELVDIRGDAVPGYVRACGWTMTPAGVPAFGCDSTFVTSGRVEFQSPGACQWTLASEADTTLLEGAACRYGVRGDRAWIALRGDTAKEVRVGGAPSGRNGYLNIVFQEGCSDTDFDPCNGGDWWGYRKSAQ